MNSPDDSASTWPYGEGETTDADPLDLLADPYTRHTLANLRDARGPLPLRILARRVAADVTDWTAADVPDQVVRQVETFLHYGQLPELADNGIVEYDPEGAVVRLPRNAES